MVLSPLFPIDEKWSWLLQFCAGPLWTTQEWCGLAKTSRSGQKEGVGVRKLKEVHFALEQQRSRRKFLRAKKVSPLPPNERFIFPGQRVISAVKIHLELCIFS